MHILHKSHRKINCHSTTSISIKWQHLTSSTVWYNGNRVPGIQCFSRINDSHFGNKCLSFTSTFTSYECQGDAKTFIWQRQDIPLQHPVLTFSLKSSKACYQYPWSNFQNSYTHSLKICFHGFNIVTTKQHAGRFWGEKNKRKRKKRKRDAEIQIFIMQDGHEVHLDEF